ncbi:MAG: RNA polymerase sigma factor [Pseudomonadota bacterium]
MARNAAFEVLYKDYYVRVFGLCRRLLNSSEMAEDAAQETFMRAYRNFRKYRPEQPFWAWIAAIANHHCIDLLRKQSRDPLFGEESTELAEIQAEGAPVVSSLIAGQQADKLHAAIGGLPARYRVPLVLAYFSQLSYDEIAVQLQISRNHVGVLLLRARQQLREALNQTEALT